jgi:hypothetical protein
MSKEDYTADVKHASGLHIVDRDPIKRKPWWKVGGKDESFVSVDAGYARTVSPASSSETKLDSLEELGNNVWETEDAKEIYKPIEGYEGAHRFDPSFKWSPEEEKRLVRTVGLSQALPALLINIHHSSIGALRCQPASCFSLSSLTEEISHRPSVIPCYV